MAIDIREGEGWMYAPLAVKWIAAKLDAPHKSVARAMIRLHRQGLIVWDGHTLSRTRTRLWRKGDGVPQAWPPAKALLAVVPDTAAVAERPEAVLRPAMPHELLERALKMARVGNRNEVGFRQLACQLKDAGVPVEVAALVMQLYVRKVPQDPDPRNPYTLRDAMASLTSAYRRERRAPFVVCDGNSELLRFLQSL